MSFCCLGNLQLMIKNIRRKGAKDTKGNLHIPVFAFFAVRNIMRMAALLPGNITLSISV